MLYYMPIPISLIHFDRSIDLAIKPETREITNRSSNQEEGKANDRHVT